jgi:hypothetical protein
LNQIESLMRFESHYQSSKSWIQIQIENLRLFESRKLLTQIANLRRFESLRHKLIRIENLTRFESPKHKLIRNASLRLIESN